MREFRRVNQFALIMVAVMVVGSSAVSVLMQWLGSRQLLLRYILLYGLQFVGPIVLYCASERETRPGEVLRLRRPTGYTLVLAIIFAVTIQPLLMCLSSLSSMVFHNYLNESMVRYTQSPLWMSLLATALLPAVCEEMLCRGVYLSGCRRLNVYLAAALNGIFFGILHMNPQQGIYAAVFGFFCALIAIGADSIWPAITAHFLINSMQLILAYVNEKLGTRASLLLELQKEETVWKALPVSLLLGCIGVWCLVRIFYINGRRELLKGRSCEVEPGLRTAEMFEGLCWLAGTVMAALVVCIAAGII